MISSLSDLTVKVCRLCEQTGEFLREESRKFTLQDIREKSPANLVSYVDEQAEQKLIEGLIHILPGSGFIAEESPLPQIAEHTWIIDPLDGTTNYLHGIPMYAISVGLKREEKMILGVILEVVGREMFYTWEGANSYLNGHTIRVSETGSMAACLFATGFPYYNFSRMDNYMKFLRFLMEHSRGVRRLGSAAIDLAYVACGRMDGFYEYGLQPWDVAAGSLLVANAGGCVSDFSGGREYLFGKEMISTNSNIYPSFMEALQSAFASDTPS